MCTVQPAESARAAAKQHKHGGAALLHRSSADNAAFACTAYAARQASSPAFTGSSQRMREVLQPCDVSCSAVGPSQAQETRSSHHQAAPRHARRGPCPYTAQALKHTAQAQSLQGSGTMQCRVGWHSVAQCCTCKWHSHDTAVAKGTHGVSRRWHMNDTAWHSSTVEVKGWHSRANTVPCRHLALCNRVPSLCSSRVPAMQMPCYFRATTLLSAQCLHVQARR